jgi:hypothetical protein
MRFLSSLRELRYLVAYTEHHGRASYLPIDAHGSEGWNNGEE